MQDAVNFLSSLSKAFVNGLRLTTMPVLNVSFLTFALSIVFIKVLIWTIAAVTGNNTKDDLKTGGRIDNNNNYIYRR